VKVLLVDDESDLIEILEFMVQNTFENSVEIFKSSSGNEAIKILSENKMDLCICDHNMPNGMGSDVIKHIIEKNLPTKFVLCSTILPLEKAQEYPAKRVFCNIQKPDIGEGLDKLKMLLEKEGLSKETESSYVPVSLTILELMGKLPTDIYIRVSENHYVKVLNVNDEFMADDKKRFSTKPVEVLFMKKGDALNSQQSLDSYISSALHKIMDQKNIPLPEKLSVTHTQLVEMIKFTGITPEIAEISRKSVLQSIAFINKASLVADFWKGMMLIGEYPSQLYTLHSMLCSVVVRKIILNSESTQFKLSLCAFLQDISLDSIGLMEICDYQEFLANEERFSRAEIKRYLEHPQRALELLTNFKDIPVDVDRILIEQHEMPNGEGFPKKLSASQLGALSCIFILTGILARHVLRDGNMFDMQEFLAVMEAKGYSKGFFNEPFQIIKNFKS